MSRLLAPWPSCGRSHSKPRSECRFFKATCHACGETGHIRQASEEKRKAYEKKNKASGNKALSVDVTQEEETEKVSQVSPASES